MLSAIILNEVAYELPQGRSVFKNINISLDRKISALVGVNGVGKTTLAKIITGDLLASQGKVRLNSKIVYFAQYLEQPDLSVSDYLDSHYTWSILGEQLLHNLNQNISCSQLSGGEWMRLRLACSDHESFLILDEPSNNLDHEAKALLIQFLKNYSQGILLISHDRELLSICEDILELSNQGLTKYGNGWKHYEEQKYLEQEQASYELDEAKRSRSKAQEERMIQLERQNKRNRKGRDSALKGGIPKILLGARQRKAEETFGKTNKSTLERANNKIKEAYEIFSQMKTAPIMYTDLTGASLSNHKLIAQAINYNVLFNETSLYRTNLNFTWKGNIRLAIKGHNGSGKSTLIKSIIGNSFQTTGELRTSPVKILYIDQQRKLLDQNLCIYENIRTVSNLCESEIRNNLAKLLFSGDSIYKIIKNLSGGEILRATLAYGLLKSEKPELLILDEPTNNLDLVNIKFLENLISQFKGALIIVSHDEAFLKACNIEEEFYLSTH